MRVVSLLPAATEILGELLPDRGDLVGVTHECDFPSWCRDVPRVIEPRDPSLVSADPAVIDQIITQASEAQQSVYRLDDRLLRDLAPDVIVTQKLCDVCAVDPSEVQRALKMLEPTPVVVELSPICLADVLDDIVRVGAVIGQESKARAWRDKLIARLEWIGSLPRFEPAPRVLVLEWPDPLWSAGHWVPEMIELAGGESLLSAAGSSSRRLFWEEVVDSKPDWIILACCGYDADCNAQQWSRLANHPAWNGLPAVRQGHVYAIDANSFTSRPGPRLIRGTELFVALLRGKELAPEEAMQIPTHEGHVGARD